MTHDLRAAFVLALLLVPACGGITGAEDQPLDRSMRPVPGPTPEYDFPDVRRESLSNGLELWIVSRRDVPLVSVRLLMEAGAVTEVAAQSGLASLTASMLVEGTSNRTASEIADELAYLAASLNAGAGQETTTVTLTTLSRTLEPALGIMADVVVNPTFPENEWTRVQQLRLVSLAQALDQPATLATQLFNRQVYGATHPLGRPAEGTPASVRALTTEDLRRFHETRYDPGRAHLVVVGDVDPEQMMEMAGTAFASWTREETPAAGRPASPRQGSATRLYLVDKPGAAQSEIRIGHVGVPRNHPDYFPLLVMNTILGGQFSSRINLNLREDKGYTYGASSSFEMGRQAGPFVASGGVQTAATRESIEEFMKELRDIRSGRPATDEEVAFAKTSIVRREPLTLETNTQVAGRIQEIILYDLPPDYFDTYTEQVEAVTTADVNRVASEHLHPDRFTVVVVGDRETIEEAVRELPYPVELFPAELVSSAPR